MVQGVFKMEMLSHLELVIARLGKLVRSASEVNVLCVFFERSLRDL